MWYPKGNVSIGLQAVQGHVYHHHDLQGTKDLLDRYSKLASPKMLGKVTDWLSPNVLTGNQSAYCYTADPNGERILNVPIF